jgi:hypothetical protein
MKDQPRKYGTNPKARRWKAEEVSHVGHLVIGQRSKMNPPENQGKRDSHSQQAAPEQALVHPPAQAGTPVNEFLSQQMGPK